MIKAKINVLGLGYIGLPTATLLASKGFTVNGVDTNEVVVNKINKGKAHIWEPGLDDLVKLTIKSKFFKATTRPIYSDIFIIAVPTPLHKNNNKFIPNIDFVMSAVDSITNFIKNGNSIIIESTIPVGTTKKIKFFLKNKGIDVSKINIAHCPERVLPGNILYELTHNDRVIGGINESSSLEIELFYKHFVKGNIYKTDAKTAEMCKLTENSFRDVNIAFANELSMICDKEKINTLELIKLTNKHPRVNILEPGPGVGGHCIAIDPWFIISQNIQTSNLMKTAREVNLQKTNWVINKIMESFTHFKKKEGISPILACFGLTFKANIDDVRESPSVEIISKLQDKGIEILVVEPNIETLDNLNIIDLEKTIDRADIFIFLVKHKEFINLDIDTKLNNKIVLDFCGLLKMKI